MIEESGAGSNALDRLPEVQWLDSAENPWGVPVLDVRPVTLGMLSLSGNSRCAENLGTYALDYGTDFIQKIPPVRRTIQVETRFRRDRILADGVLFVPQAMEHKWAIYFHGGQMLFIRSWLREVYVIASVEQSGDYINVTSIQGAFTCPEEEASLSLRVLNFVLRSHVLGLNYPAPIPSGMEAAPKFAAWWCMTHFGSLAQYATSHDLAYDVPDAPLRTYSMLHSAVARNDRKTVEGCLNSGTPIDFLDASRSAPLHWAAAAKRRKWWQRFLPANDTAMLQILLDRGSPVDVRSAEGVTPLMNAVQSGSLPQVILLLDRGADPNATDARGFTALHRAAEMGKTDLVRILLARGAVPNLEAQGHTPLSLAKTRNQKAIVTLLDRK